MMLFFSTDLLKDILLPKEYYSFYCKSKYFKTSFHCGKASLKQRFALNVKQRTSLGEVFPEI